MLRRSHRAVLSALGLTVTLAVLVAAVFSGFHSVLAWSRPSGAIAVGVPYKLTTLDPVGQPLDPSRPEAVSPFRLVYDTLVIAGPAGRIHPHLAAGWSIAAEGREITFRLRRDVRFHDGRPVDAAAVKFTLDRLTAGSEASPLARLLGPLKEVVVVDPERVKLVFERPFPAIWTALSWSAFGIVAPGEVAGPLGPVGSGPFVPESWVGDRLVLVANPEYRWAPSFVQGLGRPRVERVTFAFIPDRDSRLAAFQDGHLDLVELDQGETEGPALPSEALCLIVPQPNLTYLGFNVDRGPAADRAVRKAAALAIDRKTLLEAVGPVASAEARPVASGMWGVGGIPAGDSSPAADPGRARETLAAAGWKDVDGDGLVEKSGQAGSPETHLRLEVVSYNYQWEASLARLIVEQLRAVGIDAVEAALEPREALERTRRGDADAFLLSYAWYDPDIIYYFFHSSRLGLTNRTRLSDPEVDRALEGALLAVDPRTRAAAYANLFRLLEARVPWVPLAGQAVVVLADPGLGGLTLGGADEVLLYGVYRERP